MRLNRHYILNEQAYGIIPKWVPYGIQLMLSGGKLLLIFNTVKLERYGETEQNWIGVTHFHKLGGGGLKVNERENPKLIPNPEFFPVNFAAVAVVVVALLLNILEFRWIPHQIFNHRIPRSFRRKLLFRSCVRARF